MRCILDREIPMKFQCIKECGYAAVRRELQRADEEGQTLPQMITQRREQLSQERKRPSSTMKIP